MYIGNGLRYGHEVIGPLTCSDDDAAMLILSYVNGPIPGDDQTGYETDAKVVIVSDGSAGSEFRLTIKKKRFNFGTAADDIEYRLDGGDAGTAWTKESAVLYTAKAKYLYQAIDLINEIPNVYANIGNAPWDTDLETGNVIALSEQSIPFRGASRGARLETLKRDVSDYAIGSHQVAYMRVGLPEEWDQAPMRILNINGTTTGIDTGTVKLYVDNRSDAGKTKKLLVNKTQVAEQTEYLDRKPDEGIDTKGSLILEVAATDLSAASLWLTRMGL